MNHGLIRALALTLSLAIAAGSVACQRLDSESPQNPSETGALQKFRFSSAVYPERDYYVYQPSTVTNELVPLVVYLHGCSQTAPDVSVGTRWTELAQKRNFMVVYPEQFNPQTSEPSAQQVQDNLFNGNGNNCWNWFRPEHISRDAGEPASIAGITREVMQNFPVDDRRVFILGASAGAIMASTMAATYPDIYTAAGIFAGCGYPACGDITGLLAEQSIAGRVQRMPLIFLHGSADEIAPLPLGRQGLAQWLATNDYLDDGMDNNSVPREPAFIEHVGLDESLIAGAGAPDDPCLRESNSPCLGGLIGLRDSYPYSIEHYVDAQGAPLIDFWLIHGLTHNYPGGNAEGSFTDPLGPDVTTAAFEFFMAQAAD